MFTNGRLARASSLGLTIHSVELTDQASYLCALTKFAKGAKAESEKGPLVRLLVHSSPVIHDPKPNKEVFATLGGHIEIHCIASGVPVPEIVWIKNGNVISENAVLNLSNLTFFQEGTYTCQASNSEGQNQATISINFSKEATITTPLADKVVKEGNSVFWHCHAQASPSNITYRWLYENRPVTSLEVGLRSHIQDGDFGITSISRRDRGRYTCEAWNGFGSAAISSAYLDVHYKPEIRATSRQIYIFGIGMNGTVECEVDANPPATLINWTKNGLPLTDISGLVFDMVNANEKDAGLYTCQARNSIGSSQPFEMHVIVAAPPSFSIVPPEKLYIKAGESIDVECNGFGDPPPTQYWLHETKKISSTKLIITNVSHADHGLYKCVLVNPVGTVTKELNLFVKVHIKISA
uniref:Ig-like domain-containing protein n=1 Tax=Acrobeloides nanus TaxID=290746 RepID=A0A914DEC9_9BILA